MRKYSHDFLLEILLHDCKLLKLYIVYQED